MIHTFGDTFPPWNKQPSNRKLRSGIVNSAIKSRKKNQMRHRYEFTGIYWHVDFECKLMADGWLDNSDARYIRSHPTAVESSWMESNSSSLKKREKPTGRWWNDGPPKDFPHFVGRIIFLILATPLPNVYNIGDCLPWYGPACMRLISAVEPWRYRTHVLRRWFSARTFGFW